jgi:DNA polymerase-1
MPHPLILVDGSSYLYRAYHALPPLTNSKGQPTGAVKGVISMLRSLQKSYPESCIAVVFDAKGKTFRDEIFEHYKANRPPMPDDLRSQVEPIHAIVRAMGLPLLIIDGVEADDVIGTLARHAKSRNKKVIISTGDKDMAQLVNENITLVNTMTNTVMDINGVKEKFGIPPELIVDLLALMGDKVDNIPGVPGVGEKTALGVLQHIGGIEAIYKDLAALVNVPVRGAKSLPEKFAIEKDNAYLSYQLATIKTDVPLDIDEDDIKNNPPDRQALKKLFQDMEFKSWIAELDRQSEYIHEAVQVSETIVKQGDGAKEEVLSVDIKVDKSRYEIIFDEVVFDKWLKRLQESAVFAFDTETTSLDYMQASIVGFSFAVAPGEAAYVPVAHDYLGAPAQLNREWALAQLKPLLEDPNKLKVGQNLKYDAHVLSNHGIQMRGMAWDTMLESYVLDSVGRHDMDTLAQKYLDHATIHFEDIAGKGAKQLTFNQIKVEDSGPYAAEDADVTLRLHQVLWPQLQVESKLQSVFENIEMPMVPVLQKMEYTGTLISREQLAKQSRELGERLLELEKKVHELAGQPFNLASPKQLGEILFNKLGIPAIKKTATGQPSTAEEVLVELAEEYEMPRLLMEYRGLAKLKSTYTDRLPEMINSRTGRVHTSYHQAVAATGRLSSSDPNLQNIPIRTAEGRRIRQAFIAPPGFKLVAADYSQIELRIMAHLSSDPGLLHAFRHNQDVHRATAAEVFDVPLDQVSDDQRRSAKAINFGLIYGMSAFGLAKQLHVSRTEAQIYIEKYFQRYPGVKNYMDGTRELAANQGYVETLFGRRLYLPEIRDRNPMRRQAAERTAINAPMQGTAADIIKRAMISIAAWLPEKFPKVHMIMQVHDELVFEVPEAEVAEFSSAVCEKMSAAAILSVPLLVEAGSGNNWDEAH